MNLLSKVMYEFHEHYMSSYKPTGTILQWGLRWNGNDRGHSGWIPFNTWYRYVFSINISVYSTNRDEDNLTQLYVSKWDNNSFNMEGWHNPARGTFWIATGII